MFYTKPVLPPHGPFFQSVSIQLLFYLVALLKIISSHAISDLALIWNNPYAPVCTPSFTIISVFINQMFYFSLWTSNS